MYHDLQFRIIGLNLDIYRCNVFCTCTLELLCDNLSSRLQALSHLGTQSADLTGLGTCMNGGISVDTTILIADFEMGLRGLLRLYLENEGYTIIEAANGIEALEQIQKYPVDLAIIDIMMPVMNGNFLIKRIREIKYIPILFLSAKGDQQDRILGLRLGADDFITKPFVPLDICTLVKAHLHRVRQFSVVQAERENKI